MDSVQGAAPEFIKGDTYEVGDCGNFESGIDHMTFDGNVLTPTGVGTNPNKPPKLWGHRIAVYGNTAEQAEALRDRLLQALTCVGMSSEQREAQVVGFKPGMGEVTLHVGRLPAWLDMGHTCFVSAARSLPVGVPDALEQARHHLSSAIEGAEDGKGAMVLAAKAAAVLVAKAEQAPLDPSRRALIKNAISLLRLRRPVAPDVERVAADLELMLAGQATPAGKPPAEWLEVAALAELTAVRCQCCQAEYAADSYDAGFIAGSGMCQVCDAAIPAKDLPGAGLIMLPTEEQLAEALDGVKCFHDMSAELIAPRMRENLAAMIPADEQLWAVHAQGPDDLYAAFSREDAETHAAALNALPMPEGVTVSAVVIPSPWSAAEHWKYLAEQERDHASSVAAALSPKGITAIKSCRECGSESLTWQTHSRIHQSCAAQQGRLNTSDVECLFVLGCDECSETLATLSADKVAGYLSQIGQSGGQA